ncbi:MAG: hypothetical protein ABTQ27_05275 [Amaricoccus sp.]|uniref:hypothetical protein n=1 Tax=Amaricoccus sp. TaxID=1872485 RepID=UPI003315A8DD
MPRYDQDHDRHLGDDGKNEHDAAFVAYCTRCYRELRQARLAPRDTAWRNRLAWHRARFGALLSGDTELARRVAAAAPNRSESVPTGILGARADAVAGEAARRAALPERQRRAEASARRLVTANNLAELRAAIRK